MVGSRIILGQSHEQLCFRFFVSFPELIVHLYNFWHNLPYKSCQFFLKCMFCRFFDEKNQAHVVVFWVLTILPNSVLYWFLTDNTVYCITCAVSSTSCFWTH